MIKQKLTASNKLPGCSGAQVYPAGVSLADIIFRSRECHCERVDHAEVGDIAPSLATGNVKLTRASSVVLWVSQNMEDDYTYNLAL